MSEGWPTDDSKHVNSESDSSGEEGNGRPESKNVREFKFEPGASLLVTDEFRGVIVGRKKGEGIRLGRMVVGDVEEIAKNPLGKRSVDSRKWLLDNRAKRSVNKLSGEIAEVVGKKIVVKQVRRDPDNPEVLKRQFIKMVELRRLAEEKFNQVQNNLLSFNSVYALLRVQEERDGRKEWQEYLFMEEVEGESFEYGNMLPLSLADAFDIGVVIGGKDGKRGTRSIKAVKDPDVPGGIRIKKREKGWNPLARKLKSMGLEVDDFYELNVFKVNRGDGSEHYVVIDQGREDVSSSEAKESS